MYSTCSYLKSLTENHSISCHCHPHKSHNIEHIVDETGYDALMGLKLEKVDESSQRIIKRRFNFLW